MTPPAPAARAAIHARLAARADDATVCPSEVARVLAEQQDGVDTAWRDRMAEVHAAVDAMLAEGVVRLSWKGEPLAARAGPYRIRRGSAGPG